MQIHFHFNLDDRLLAAMRRWLPRNRLVAVLTTLAATAAGALYALAPAPPLEFKAGDPVSAAKMNTLFKELYAGVSQAAPVGTIVAFAGDVPPAGWLRCDGTEKSMADYPALAKVLDVKYGTPKGLGQFVLPDLRGRFALGAGQGPGLANRTLATTYGEEAHKLTLAELPAHTHGVTDPGHYHTMTMKHYAFGNTSPLNPFNGATMASNSGSSSISTGKFMEFSKTDISIQNSGGDQKMGLIPPALAVHYIIKT